MKNILYTDFMAKSMVLLFTALMLMLTACEGPAGSQGPRGPEGAVGQVGPAGEDGSVMWAGPGEPAGDIGAIGDYYLNSTTGEFYGPKSEDGWGDPIIVLMGDDGEDGTKIHSGSGAPDASLGVNGDFYLDLANQDLYGPKTGGDWGDPVSLNGQDGADGQDGEDGSQIYAGNGPPDASIGKAGDYYFDEANKDLYGPKTDSGWGPPISLNGEDGQDGEDGSQIYAGTGAPDAAQGKPGDYYLDKSSFDLYGPKTDSGWGTPINIKGAKGNANVTRYIFPGHDFEQDYRYILNFNDTVESESEMRESAWMVYILDLGSTYRHVPGDVPDVAGTYNTYAVSHEWNGSDIRIIVELTEGNGDEYNGLEVVRIESSNTDDRTGVNNSLIPDHLDISDYNTVARHYGFGNAGGETLKH